MKKINLTWDRFKTDTLLLIDRFPQDFKKIVGVARGGLFPATILAHSLGIRDMGIINVESYDRNGKQKKPILNLVPKDLNFNNPETLIVDDLVDTGDTFRELRKHFPKAKYAAVYAKSYGIHTADFKVQMYDQDVWLNFPWEIPL